MKDDDSDDNDISSTLNTINSVTSAIKGHLRISGTGGNNNDFLTFAITSNLSAI